MVPGGVTGDTVLNMMRGIRDEKYKKTESTDKNHTERAAAKAADIAEQMTLGEPTVDKLEAIEEDDERLESMGNITKPSMEEMLMMYGETFRVQTSKETFRLDYIVLLNASGFLNNSAVV